MRIWVIPIYLFVLGSSSTPVTRLYHATFPSARVIHGIKYSLYGAGRDGEKQVTWYYQYAIVLFMGEL